MNKDRRSHWNQWRRRRRTIASVLVALLTCLILVSEARGTAKPSFSPESAIAVSESVENGRELFEQGQYAQAARVWQDAATRADDRLDRALSLTYLSLAYRQLGDWSAARDTISQSFEILETSPSGDRREAAILAKATNARASVSFAIGEIEGAVQTWELARDRYAALGDRLGVLGSQINQAQALQMLGDYRQANLRLEQVETQLRQQTDLSLTATGWQSLALAVQHAGEFERARELLEKSHQLFERLNSPNPLATSWIDRGNNAHLLGDDDGAIAYYQKAAATATRPLLRVQARLNHLHLLIRQDRGAEIEALLAVLEPELNALDGGGREEIYARVNYTIALLDDRRQSDRDRLADAGERLGRSFREAEQLGDPIAQSYTLGTLGELYERTGQLDSARSLFERALALALHSHADHIAYRWQWRLGRVLGRTGDRDGAIAAYGEAVNTLQSLRQELVAMSQEVQFSFRERVEPIYREFIDLLLQPKFDGGAIAQTELQQALKTLENLQLIELENFLQQPCLQAKPQPISGLDPHAAVIYPILLDRRLAIVVSLPDGTLSYHETLVSQTEVEEAVEGLLRSLNPALSDRQRLQLSEQLYRWLLAPLEPELVRAEIETLVFVLEGALKNLPMGVLYDGERYAIDKYALAVAPGLQLLGDTSLTPHSLQVIAGGLAQGRRGFSPLPGVKLELEKIAAYTETQTFLDEAFTSTMLQKQVDDLPFRVLHLATHGQFSSRREETYIVTWDDRLDLEEFGQLLESRQEPYKTPIELLVLSACQTALGDKRAALGLAGVAVNSGARSTVASLWSVHDGSTAMLMEKFYEFLARPQTSKAQALRQAQLFLKEQSRYEHPFYWAAFVLVGHWS
ncbi:CHAT domain-containing protein [Oxynema sp. CENA135]|uniref:CHAT domain-containing protein n=1 Tax=Oxynema sp. CENA135 TaxID=984206 RepID=UPI00190AB124|nr:CHAT domain-containing protein [Oxynema sp. CENA135]MBK4729113.1 CHAT domain-containing protein [Oxynema sp. CENA135]